MSLYYVYSMIVSIDTPTPPLFDSVDSDGCLFCSSDAAIQTAGLSSLHRKKFQQPWQSCICGYDHRLDPS